MKTELLLSCLPAQAEVTPVPCSRSTFRMIGHTGSICPAIRLLGFSMILIMLVVRFGSFSEKLLVIPIEDALFDVACISDGDSNLSSKSQIIMSKHSLDCDVPRCWLAIAGSQIAEFSGPDHAPRYYPDDTVTEIFIPPE